ncbi:hypothetical protein RF11_15620 [Thelohanellus kitauei]|uniref:Uncharacterized protein n=1 Tax=Thelohanellus kitauei TaxID=669202 RepID=A0A0C2JWR3_THEKT|nr:hypothetical protein RF11_15620 [Thelohanellus kitauei]
MEIQKKNQGNDPDVEEALDPSFSIVSGKGVNITGHILQAKSQETSMEIQKKNQGNDPDVEEALDPSFSIVSGKGVNITGHILQAKSQDANNESAEQLKTTKIPTFLENFRLITFKNAYETGLYYRDTPDGSFCYKHIALSGYKKAMDRTIMLCCTNISGTDKQKLLIIGNSAQPRSFKEQIMEVYERSTTHTTKRG